MEQPVVNMADVARAAGVHQTTVSRALRQDPALPAETRKRIAALAEQMGYRRNPYVSALISERKRGLSSGHGAVLGILAAGPRPDGWRHGSSTFQKLHEHLVNRARILGYGTEEFLVGTPELSSKRLRNILLNRGIRGLIISPMPMGWEELDFDFADFAAVAIRLRLRSPEFDRVAPDYFAGMNIALDVLTKAGHRKIAFATIPRINEQVGRRSLGAYAAARELQPSRFLKPMVNDRWTKESFIRWLNLHKPDALVTPIYPVYSKFKSWLEQENWNLPAKLSLISLDCHLDTPEAGIEQNLEEEARNLVNLVTRRVECAEFGVPRYPSIVSVPGVWRDGECFAERGGQAQGRR